MYLNTQTLKDGACLWISALQVPWMGNFILGIQGNNQGDPDPVFTALKEAWGWNIRNGFDLLAKPIVLLVVLMVKGIAAAHSPQVRMFLQCIDRAFQIHGFQSAMAAMATVMRFRPMAR